MSEFTKEQIALWQLAMSEIARTARTQLYEYYTLKDSGNSTSNEVFTDKVIRQDHLVILTNVCAGTDDVNSSYVEFGVWNGVTFKPFYVASQATDSVLVSWQGQVILREGEALRVKIRNTTGATDTLTVFATGYELRE